MTKIIKIILRYLGRSFEWLVILIFLLFFLIRMPLIQTIAAKQGAEYLSKELNAEIQIDRLEVIFPTTVIIEGLRVKDTENKPVLNSGKIMASLSVLNLVANKYVLSKVELKNTTAHLSKSKRGVLNIQFIIDFFKPDKPKEKSTPFLFGINQTVLSNVDFTYDDFSKEKKTVGMDYMHLDLKNVSTHIKHFRTEGKTFTATIHQLSCQEKCGFQLDDFIAEANFSEKGIFLNNVTIQSPGTHVKSSQLNLETKNYKSYASFIDSVTFDVHLEESKVWLKDVAYFAPTLDGMRDTVQLFANVTKPISQLRIENFELKYKNETQLNGSFDLPDFRKLKQTFFHERIEYCKVNIKELESFTLPNTSSQKHISLGSKIENLEYIEAKNTRIDGFFSQFVVSSEIINTALGDIKIDNGIMVNYKEDRKGFSFHKSQASTYDIKIEHFNLGKLIETKALGIVDADIFLNGEVSEVAGFVLEDIDADIHLFEAMDYPYRDITYKDGSIHNKVLAGKITLADENIDLKYDGTIDFRDTLKFDCTIDIAKAELDKLNLLDQPTSLATNISVDLVGIDPNTMHGNIQLAKTKFMRLDKGIESETFTFSATRSDEEDVIKLNSDLIEFTISGKVDFNTVKDQVLLEAAKAIPALSKQLATRKTVELKDHFSFYLNFIDVHSILEMFADDYYVAENSIISGSFNGPQNFLDLNIKSGEFKYKKLQFSEIELNQEMDEEHFAVDYSIGTFKPNDSLSFKSVHFVTDGLKNSLHSNLTWGTNGINESNISWHTDIVDINHFDVEFSPSYFSIDSTRWSMNEPSTVSVKNDTLAINDFVLKNENQSISCDGRLSEQDHDKLIVVITELKLEEIGKFLPTVELSGTLNANYSFSNPYNNLTFDGESNITTLFVDKQEVGDVNVNSNYNHEKQEAELNGSLTYKNFRSFEFDGNYNAQRTESPIKLDLLFDKADISFTNAFLDPKVMSDIEGYLNGSLNLSGTIEKPILEGDLDFDNGKARIAMVGAQFGINGLIKIRPDMIMMDALPISDEEGNTGMVNGTVLHKNFKDFDFNITVDLEDDPTKRLAQGGLGKVERFLVVNSEYKEDAIFYGKAYATGIAEISGSTKNLGIVVDIETQKGTKLNIPMFGSKTVDEEYDFITFKQEFEDSLLSRLKSKYNFKGVDLDLKINVTPSAQVGIVFNDDTGDRIEAKGKGLINISINKFGELEMNGIYAVTNGFYNMVLGPIIQKFYLEKDGTISWTGDIADAHLNLRAYHKVNANIAAVTGNKLASGSGAHQEVFCYLSLKDKLSSPTITFDLNAPSANEEAKSVISRIKSDPDELNRQFLSLLLWKKFQPLSGGNAQSDGSAALNLIAGQINALLDQVSEDFKLSVDLNKDQITGDNSYEFGVSKTFLEDKLIVSGSFGVDQQTQGTTQNKNNLIGDIYIEYLLNESGTFRVNGFNETVDRTIIQNQNRGLMTQGVGLTYKEEFNTWKEFKAIQLFLDLFRRKENKRVKRDNKRKTLVPKD